MSKKAKIIGLIFGIVILGIISIKIIMAISFIHYLPKVTSNGISCCGLELQIDSDMHNWEMYRTLNLEWGRMYKFNGNKGNEQPVEEIPSITVVDVNKLEVDGIDDKLKYCMENYIKVKNEDVIDSGETFINDYKTRYIVFRSQINNEECISKTMMIASNKGNIFAVSIAANNLDELDRLITKINIKD